MCLLTYLPEGVQPNVEELIAGTKINSDGHGFAIVIPEFHDGKGRILVRKSMKPDDLIKEFVELRRVYPHGPAMFHSRYTTDGKTALFNCQPFMLANDRRTVLAHNGVFPRSSRPLPGDKRSDTRIFAEEIGSRFELHTALGRQIAGEWIGSYNKVAILTVDPAYRLNGFLINEDSGLWRNGIWYSNTTFQPYSPKWDNWDDDYDRYGNYYTYKGTKTGTTFTPDGWEWCEAAGCSPLAATVDPETLRCTLCHACVNCASSTCICGGPYKGTVIGGTPKAGATVTRTSVGTGWVERYRTAVERRAITAAANGVDIDPEDDQGMSESQLQQVIDLVGRYNNGEDVPDPDDGDFPPDSPAPDACDVVYEAEQGDQDYLVHEGVKYAVN